ncbi:MAG: hypothetical protein KDB62_01345 [Solirubrobacterales bacterium]|nr:hypothetical protein [Solirubrobacterales bacterium]
MAGSRFIAVALICGLSGLGVVACGDSSDDNAEQFKRNVAALDPALKVKFVDLDQPGVVKGSLRAPNGLPSFFWISFGPDPADDLERFDLGDPTFVMYYNVGDGYYIAEDARPRRGLNASARKMTQEERNRWVDSKFAIEDAACEAVSGEACKGP